MYCMRSFINQARGNFLEPLFCQTFSIVHDPLKIAEFAGVVQDKSPHIIPSLFPVPQSYGLCASTYLLSEHT